MAGPYEHGNELFGYGKGREYAGQLRHCHLLNKDCAPQTVDDGDDHYNNLEKVGLFEEGETLWKALMWHV